MSGLSQYLPSTFGAVASSSPVEVTFEVETVHAGDGDVATLPFSTLAAAREDARRCTDKGLPVRIFRVTTVTTRAQVEL